MNRQEDLISSSEKEAVSQNIPRSFPQSPRTPSIQPNPKLYCIFCNTASHHSHQCNKYKNSQQFWQAVLETRRCKNCLRLFHRSNKCFNQSFCHLMGCRRQDKHSPVLCRMNYIKYHLDDGVPHSWSIGRCNINSVPNFFNRRHYVSRKFNHSSSVSFNKVCAHSENAHVQTDIIHQASCKSNVSPCDKISISTQTDPCEELTSICTQTSQTENISVTVSCQTALQIPPSTNIFNYFPVPKSRLCPIINQDAVRESPCKNSQNEVNESHLEVGSTKLKPRMSGSPGVNNAGAKSSSGVNVSHLGDGLKVKVGINGSSNSSPAPHVQGFISSAIDKYTKFKSSDMVSKISDDKFEFSKFLNWK